LIGPIVIHLKSAQKPSSIRMAPSWHSPKGGLTIKLKQQFRLRDEAVACFNPCAT
jgi:hypothetical protein